MRGRHITDVLVTHDKKEEKCASTPLPQMNPVF